ncbi:sigma-70 family RNA polymerase sigma factor [Bradyrhizobium sp. LHD-71]|uniref:RNA polymerase sigma factor n=1 Tax=Bradyrhizobium sp. LHD-71 TaxID=3072141 RepID=UPI00280C6C48|nr:sigma-70 family RNA polymerase sigma factor [Bradyrhizobium sp. LHD-71]MDQ8728080.1 sigma-70 family RNA polymerase sigma factor [Bradyrhizobium sp. LHD-71]
MNELANATTLRQLLIGQYDELKRLLARRLGSEDLAGDVLQETYLHLQRPTGIGPVTSPKHYLLTIATNIARMGFRRGRRWTSLSDLDAAVGLVDNAPDPLQVLEGREAIAALQQAFEDLTPRRRYIVFASRLAGERLCDIATELGLSQRQVEKELKIALMQCGSKLDREVIRRFGPRVAQSSQEQVRAVPSHEGCDD